VPGGHSAVCGVRPGANYTVGGAVYRVWLTVGGFGGAGRFAERDALRMESDSLQLDVCEYDRDPSRFAA
jgi:hypothetical protein